MEALLEPTNLTGILRSPLGLSRRSKRAFYDARGSARSTLTSLCFMRCRFSEEDKSGRGESRRQCYFYSYVQSCNVESPLYFFPYPLLSETNICVESELYSMPEFYSHQGKAAPTKRCLEAIDELDLSMFRDLYKSGSLANSHNHRG